MFLHHDAFVEAAGLPAYVMAGLAAYSSGQSLGASRTGAWSGVLAYAFTPALLIAVTGTKNDPHMAAYYLTSVAIILDLARRKQSSSEGAALPRLTMLALVLMLAVSTKTYLVHLLPGLAILWITGFGTRSVLGQTRGHLTSAKNGFKQRTGLGRTALLALLVAGVFLAGHWNVRNWATTGNPFYPHGIAIREIQVLSQGYRSTQVDVDRLLANLKDLSIRFGDRVQSISSDLPNTTG